MHDQWKLFSEQCKFLLINIGLFSKHSEPGGIATVLNWLGLKSYQVFKNLNFDAKGKDKTKIGDVLFTLKSISNPHNLYFNHGTSWDPSTVVSVKIKLSLCLNCMM